MPILHLKSSSRSATTRNFSTGSILNSCDWDCQIADVVWTITGGSGGINKRSLVSRLLFLWISGGIITKNSSTYSTCVSKMASNTNIHCQKHICLQFQAESLPPQQYDVSFVSENGSSDIAMIEGVMRKKLRRFFEQQSVTPILRFEKPSEIVSGTWSVVGDDSPVKNATTLVAKCIVPYNVQCPQAASSPISPISSTGRVTGF